MADLGIKLRNRSCPAVSHSCSRTVLSSRYIVLDRKSIPIVACMAPDYVSRGPDRADQPRKPRDAKAAGQSERNRTW